MKKECSHCGVDFEPEPGFYYGAMFVSYIGSAFLLLASTFTLVFVFGCSLSLALGVLFTILLLGHAYLFKISRSIWLHWFVKYDPSKASKMIR